MGNSALIWDHVSLLFYNAFVTILLVYLVKMRCRFLKKMALHVCVISQLKSKNSKEITISENQRTKYWMSTQSHIHVQSNINFSNSVGKKDVFEYAVLCSNVKKINITSLFV